MEIACFWNRKLPRYNGSQKIVCKVDMVFVRIDGDGEPVPLSDKVKKKYGKEIL